MIKILLYTCTTINLISIICLFLMNYINIFFINEQILNIPTIEYKNSDKFKYPKVEEKNIYNFALLKSKNDEPESFFDTNEEKIKNQLPLHIRKKEKTKDKTVKNLTNKKFIVQLGVFKNKVNAENKKRQLGKKMKNVFSEFPLILKPFKKGGNTLFSVSTKFIEKKKAVELCNLLKKNKIGCIIKIQEG